MCVCVAGLKRGHWLYAQIEWNGGSTIQCALLAHSFNAHERCERIVKETTGKSENEGRREGGAVYLGCGRKAKGLGMIV